GDTNIAGVQNPHASSERAKYLGAGIIRSSERCAQVVASRWPAADARECCSVDTVLTSLASASRRRPTTDLRSCFAMARMTLILGAIGPSSAPALPHAPPRSGQCRDKASVPQEAS